MVAAVIVREAFARFAEPPAVAGAGLLAVATGGLVVNGIALVVLRSGSRSNLNLRGAWLHVLSDALGSLGAMGAGAAIWLFGWRIADPIASVAISALPAK